MALLHYEGFDFNGAVDALLRGWSANRESATGRGGVGKALSITQVESLYYSLASTVDCMIVGFALQWPASTSTGPRIMQFTTAAGASVADLRYDATGGGSVTLLNSSGATVGTWAGPPKTIGQWYFFELKVKVSTGAWEVRQDGNSLGSGTGASFGATAIGRLFLSTANYVLINVDDLYICDDSTGTNNDFLGDVKVATLLPTADGAHADWTPNYAPAFEASGTGQGAGSGVSSFAYTLPAYSAGDVILLQVVTENVLDHNPPVTATGWTKVCTDTNLTGWSDAQRIFMRQMTAADVSGGVNSVTLVAGGSAPNSTTWAVRSIVYQFADSSLDIAGDTVVVSSASTSSSSLTTGGANRVIVSFFLGRSGSSNSFSPTTPGVVERWDAQGTGQTFPRLACEELKEASAGTYTLAGTQGLVDYSVLQTVVLKPTAAHWMAVDEVPPNDDTSYVSSSTPNNVDTYVLADTPANAEVLSVKTNIYAKKSEPGNRQVAPVIRIGTTDYPGTAVSPGTSYAYLQQRYDANDPSGSAWTKTTVDAMEFGVKEVA